MRDEKDTPRPIISTMAEEANEAIKRASGSVRNLVLDAGPLITQTTSTLQQFADTFYTTPGVHSELKDEHARQQLLLWGDNLKLRHPSKELILRVSRFAKLTGDYAVLSVNDLHIIALAYELEVELNNGDWRLRSYPGEPLNSKNGESESLNGEEPKEIEVKEKKPRRRGGKKQREKKLHREQNKENINSASPEDSLNTSSTANETEEWQTVTSDRKHSSNSEALNEEYEENEDDGEWITPENLDQQIVKDGDKQILEAPSPVIKVALATGDFACQNVAMQIGLNLMNEASGKQIKRIRNYMYRCHACFRLTPMAKDGTPKHFCPNCGGNSLLRCAVSIDNKTGKVTPHLKANFHWIKRGDRYSLPSPLSKNQQKLQGNRGYQHNKQNQDLILREDQKEYQKALKNDAWQRKQNEKLLEEWVGGGSADNYVSPFNTTPTIKSSGVKVGRSRYVNSSQGRKKR